MNALTNSEKAPFQYWLAKPLVMAALVYCLAYWAQTKWAVPPAQLQSMSPYMIGALLLHTWLAHVRALDCTEPYRAPTWVRVTTSVYAVFFPSVFAGYIAAMTANQGGWVFAMVGLVPMALVFLVVAPFATWVTAAYVRIGTNYVMWPLWIIMGHPDSEFFKSGQAEPVTREQPNAPVAAAPAKEAIPLPPASEQQAPQKPKYEFEWSSPTTSFATMAGMAELKAELNLAITPFRGYVTNGPVADRNGIILSGPPGNGKTTVAVAIAGELGLPFVKVSGVDVTSMYVNESAAMLKELFTQAAKTPCVVFIDELDSILKSRGSANVHDEDKKVVTAFLTLVDEARAKRIVLVAATNYLDQLDKAAIRDGRFDYRIEVPYPDREARNAILAGLVSKFKLQVNVGVVEHVAALWERRSIAFMEATVKRVRDSGKGTASALATVEDFKEASRQASRRAGNIPSTGSKVSEIALPASVRREVDSLIYRLLNWERISEQGGEPPSGVLLYGPPGTGKTNLVRAVAREMGCWHVFEVNATDVIQDPRKFKEIVELAAEHRPAIVFIDEADELLRNRSFSNSAGATNEILKCMDGMMGKVPEVVFVAATNNAEAMDAAALRGGRFAEKIFMGRLSGSDLVEFLAKEFAMKGQAVFDQALTPDSLAERLGEAAPADAKAILRKAINYTFAPNQAVRPVTMADVDAAVVSLRT